MDKKSAISCAVLDIEPTRHSTVKKKLWKKLKKNVYDGVCTHADFTEKIMACMHACL